MKKVGDWELHIDLGVLRRGSDEVQLTPRSMSVLTHLVARQGELVSADSLLEIYWQGSFTADNAVAKAISEIRHVLRNIVILSIAKDLKPRSFAMLVRELGLHDDISLKSESFFSDPNY